MSTALELGRKGWKPYLDAEKRRRHVLAPSLDDEHEKQRVMAEIRKLAEELKSRFEIRRVVLFGSLAHAAWFVSDSDVDLAVEGLSDDVFWDAWRLAEEMISDRTVDLIELEKVSPSLREAVERYGVEL